MHVDRQAAFVILYDGGSGDNCDDDDDLQVRTNGTAQVCGHREDEKDCCFCGD